MGVFSQGLKDRIDVWNSHPPSHPSAQGTAEAALDPFAAWRSALLDRSERPSFCQSACAASFHTASAVSGHSTRWAPVTRPALPLSQRTGRLPVVATAYVYADHVLVQAPGLADTVIHGGTVVRDYADDQF